MVLANKTKTPSVHQKKRNGQHHKPTKAYHKTYWPYLPLIAIVSLGIGANTLWSQASRGVLGYATDMSASALLAGTNSQRTARGENTLKLNIALDNAAQAKANNMAALNYWSHDTPSGQAPWVFITAAGYNYAVAGENLAYGFNSSSDVLTAWMASSEHRANILNREYQDVGFGIANATNYQNHGPETIVVAEYGAPAVPAATDAAAAIPRQNTMPTSVTSATQPTTPVSTTQPQATPNSTPVALNADSVSRLQLVTNNAIDGFLVGVIATFAIGLFLIHHGLIWRRVLVRGEAFVVRYHALDILFVTIGVIGFVVTRSAGYIH